MTPESPIDDLLARLTAASMELETLREPVEEGAPWPLAERFDHAPEAAWGPPEVLAHTAEMLRFWSAQLATVLEGGPDPVRFGRIASNELRTAIIERDRQSPIRWLLATVAAEIERVHDQLEQLYEDDFVRTGEHETLGSMTVLEIADRFFVSHLEEHVRQLEAAVPVDGGGGPPTEAARAD
jgi:hypothetical protein